MSGRRVPAHGGGKFPQGMRDLPPVLRVSGMADSSLLAASFQAAVADVLLWQKFLQQGSI